MVKAEQRREHIGTGSGTEETTLDNKEQNQHSLHFPLKKKVETLLKIRRRIHGIGSVFRRGRTERFVGRWVEKVGGQTDCRRGEVAISGLL
jgi:hypothetical protein